MELVEQPLYHPLSLHEKVITLCAATHKVMLGIEKAKSNSSRQTCFVISIQIIRKSDRNRREKVLTEELIERSWRPQRNSRRAGVNMANIREIQSRINSVKIR